MHHPVVWYKQDSSHHSVPSPLPQRPAHSMFSDAGSHWLMAECKEGSNGRNPWRARLEPIQRPPSAPDANESSVCSTALAALKYKCGWPSTDSVPTSSSRRCCSFLPSEITAASSRAQRGQTTKHGSWQCSCPLWHDDSPVHRSRACRPKRARRWIHAWRAARSQRADALSTSHDTEATVCAPSCARHVLCYRGSLREESDRDGCWGCCGTGRCTPAGGASPSWAVSWRWAILSASTNRVAAAPAGRGTPAGKAT